MVTIGKLTKKYRLSRSTLLYYDKLGLLKPSERNDSNYRLYSEEDIKKLEFILRHREAGISLDDISKLMHLEQNNITDILSDRLKTIQSEVFLLKKQENMILSVLINEVTIGKQENFDRKSWTSLLKNLGYSEEDLTEWHIAFEKKSSQAHKLFLKALGMSDKERAELVKTKK